MDNEDYGFDTSWVAHSEQMMDSGYELADLDPEEELCFA